MSEREFEILKDGFVMGFNAAIQYLIGCGIRHAGNNDFSYSAMLKEIETHWGPKAILDEKCLEILKEYEGPQIH